MEAMARHMRKLEALVWTYNIRPRGPQPGQAELSDAVTDTEDENSSEEEEDPEGEFISELSSGEDEEEDQRPEDQRPEEVEERPKMERPVTPPTREFLHPAIAAQRRAVTKQQLQQHQQLQHLQHHQQLQHHQHQQHQQLQHHQQHQQQIQQFAMMQQRQAQQFGQPAGFMHTRQQNFSFSQGPHLRQQVVLQGYHSPQRREVAIQRQEKYEMPDVVSFDRQRISSTSNVEPISVEDFQAQSSPSVSEEQEQPEVEEVEEEKEEEEEPMNNVELFAEEDAEEGEEDKDEQDEESYQNDEDEMEPVLSEDGENVRVYADNARNRRLSRVGLPYGAKPETTTTS